MIVFLIRIYFIFRVLFASILLRTGRYVYYLLVRGIIDLGGWGPFTILLVMSMQKSHTNVM